MRPVWQLWLQLWRRMPLLGALGSLIWLAGMGLLLYAPFSGGGMDAPGLMLLGFGAWFWHMGHGTVLRALCQPESFLLPGFRRHLLVFALFDVLQWIALPLLLAAIVGLPHLPLVATAGVLIASLGLAIGCGRRIGLLIWLVVIAAGWMPRLMQQVAQAAIASPLTPLLILLAAALLLAVTLRPLLRIDDREADVSPLESTSLGRMNTRTPDGGSQPRGALGKRIAGLFDHVAQRAMEQALQRYRQQPGAMRRQVLLRRLLLPHDNPPAIALRLALVAGMVTIYFFAAMHRQHFSAAAVGAYAILLALSRFPQLGRGMLRMRPNLADLYLTLAPTTRAEYQKSLADALLVLVPISILTALAYTLLGIVLTHASEPLRMLLTAAIVAGSASLVALAVHLVGPEGTVGRSVVNLLVVFGAMGVYWGGYALLGLLGQALGGALLALVTLSFGIGVWFAAQREYQRRAPCFDAPLG